MLSHLQPHLVRLQSDRLLLLHSTPDFWPGWVYLWALLIYFQQGATPAKLSTNWCPRKTSEQRKFRRVVLHWRLHLNLRPSFNNSHLLCTTKFTSQQHATVKFHGVFTSHWKSLAFAPEKGVRWILTRDSGDLVTPFMQAVNQTARHFATLREL